MTFQSPAILPKLSDLVAEYDRKLAALPELHAMLSEVVKACDMGATVGTEYRGGIWGRGGRPSMQSPDRALRSSAWVHCYRGMNIHRIAPANERDRFEREFDDPPEFTIDNIRATFGDYLLNSRYHVLRGLAQQFANLDPAYKSHSKVKIGVKGLPKRVIVANAAAQYGNHGKDRLADIINALRTAQGKPALERYVLQEACQEARANDVDLDGVTLRGFQNGNMHVIFDAQTCHDINSALAEFYGEVLPDVEGEVAEKSKGTNVSADLAYFPTPAAVCTSMLSDVYIREGQRVLEPSCGCGRILDAARKSQPEAVLRGIEYHAGRAAEARAKGYAVQRANFLDVPPDPTFDWVLMNPPFAGRHWIKHINHALRFLKEDGGLVAILPASAFYDGHLSDMKGRWRDLPVASFSESGTNVPTGYFHIWAKDAQSHRESKDT